MHQKTYVLDENLAPDEMDRLIAADPLYLDASATLMQVYEPKCDDPAMIMERMRLQREILPKASIVGMTTLGPLSPETQMPSDPMVSVLHFEKSEFSVHLYDCHHMSPREAGARLCEEIAQTAHVRGVLLLTSCARLSPTPVIEELEQRYPDIRIFGAQAGTEVLGNDQSMVFTSSEVCDKGVLAVVFHGADLHIRTDYNLGWTPLGKELTITGVEDDGFVTTIDGMPAASIYEKYLGVEKDESFYANVCSFPLLTRSGTRLIARVPTMYTEDDKLQFGADLAVGSRVKLSYARPENLLRATLASANEMARFAPQATIVFTCVNRRVYMGNERADRELDYYRKAAGELSYAYGYGEILRTAEGGELLTSTFVAAGMREGDVPDGFEPVVYEDPELTPAGMTYKPLADRLVTFLEATTAELRDTIGELETLAQRDQLTGIYNRRRTDEILEQRLHGRRKGDNVALLMYDIDHFKVINDTYGHERGDTVLKELTEHVLGVIRAEDALGRWGGEEFLVVAADATLEQARGLAERIRRHVERAEFSDVGKVTISVGVACADEGDTAGTLFNRADKALYDAKNSGRNCVAVR